MRRKVTRHARYVAWAAPLALVGAAAAAGCTASVGSPHGGSGNGASASGGSSGGSSSGGGSGVSGSGSGGGGSSGVGPGGSPCPPLAAALQGDNTIPAGTAPLVRRLWRLSAQQWGNAVRELLTLPQAPALTNTGGTADYAFFSDDAAVVDASLQYSIYQATQAVMTQIAPQITKIAACMPNEAQPACATRFAQSFGQKAFRRPLEAAEVTALLAPFTEGAKQDFNTGISLMIQALIQSPSFVHRSELGPTTLVADASGKYPDTTLTPFEVATQLSFLFTNTVPDQPLLDAAANGGLASAQGIAAQIDRLLTLPSVKQNIDQIVVDWFNVRQLFTKTKDPAFFASLPAADQNQTLLENDVYASTQKFVDDVIWSPSGKVTDLLTSQKMWVTPRLGQLYRLPVSGAANTFVAVNDPNRSGILTQPGFLWAASNPTNTSIVKRGKFIHDDVICVDPGPGPGNILSDPAVVAALAMLPTEIDKSNYRLKTQPCMSCHNQIDPYALVLESFGPIGEYRTMADGIPTQTTANFGDPLPTGPLTGPAAFAKALIDNKLLTTCAVQKMASYTLGRMIRTRGTCELQGVHTEFEKTDGSVSSLFRQVATASFMRARSGGTK